MTTAAPSAGVSEPRVARRLAPAPALRVFSWNGRTQAHVSAVPLPFVSCGDALARARANSPRAATAAAARTTPR